MKLLDNYIKATEALEEYFGIDNLNYYSVNIYNDFFCVSDKSNLAWAETEEELKSQDGNYYESEIKKIKTTDELTLVLVESYFGEDDFWIIFKNENKRDYDTES